MPTITIEITNCTDCPLCKYNEWFQGYKCYYHTIGIILGKDYDEEVEMETEKVLSWENGKPIGCPAKI